MIDLEAEIQRFVRVQYQGVFDRVHDSHARRPVPAVRQAILDELRQAGTTPRKDLVDGAAEAISAGNPYTLP
ncbi:MULTISPECIES: hypothetical protein [Actinocatenispora]|jgi:hypothetical protein|uniref:Uncharacterized protein n=2 Tax=Actinocatenispora TaxID=390988 RepID=A0A8J4AFB0_9ACTN|nr:MULTISPECIES: hypothetical protein [Actinocatenispora]BCJ35879.1 hypothetical protein Athai_33820 [Actinocatenispora thailandica]GIL30028.1 hypothetical protein NUM_52820 [Actinocatenispora comari]